MRVEFSTKKKKKKIRVLYRITGKLLPNDPKGRRIPTPGSYSLPNDRVPRTLYLKRVHDFIGTEGILHVAGIVALVSSLHVPQRQRVVRPDVRPVVKNPDVINTPALCIYIYLSLVFLSPSTYFCCNLTSPRRHSTVGRGIPTARQAILTSTLQGTTSGTPNDIIAAGTN